MSQRTVEAAEMLAFHPDCDFVTAVTPLRACHRKSMLGVELHWSPCASVLWLPPGAQQFASKHAWPGKVAYSSQFMTPMDRAYHAMEKIKRRLIGELDPEQWDLPPKPKWMRWKTYRRLVEEFERYEAAIDAGALSRASKLMRRG